MKKWAYYNDNDPKVCACIRELMRAGLITEGEVDERSITEIRAGELSGFLRVHMFCGIAGWEYALRLAGWPDDEAVWTGSCPCQPFSSAGKAGGVLDARHLWPAFRGLIAECRPAIVFGEQVASKDGRAWLSGVRSDLEGDGYALGGADLCAAGVGAPHIRQRLYWVAHSKRSEWRPKSEGRNGEQHRSERQWEAPSGFGNGGETGLLANMQQPGLEGHYGNERDGREPGRLGTQAAGSTAARGGAGGMAIPECVQRTELARSGNGPGGEKSPRSSGQPSRPSEVGGRFGDPESSGHDGQCLHPNGEPTVGATEANAWSDFDLIPCRDGKSRRIPKPEPGFLLLADGFWYNLADVLSKFYEEAIKEINAYAKTTGTSPKEVLRVVQNGIREDEIRSDEKTPVGQIGGIDNFQKKAVLLDPLWRALSAQAQPTTNCGGEQKTHGIAPARMLRDLRAQIEDECASLRRKSNEQLNGQSPDPLLALSQFLAQCCEACRGYAVRSNATSFPLCGKVKGRIAMLRGSGNAIVPQVAAEFISAYLETLTP